MSRLLIKWLQKVEPEQRLLYSARLFIISLVLGVLSTVFLCKSPFERVLMAISWFAIVATCMDIISTTDVRANED